MGGEGFSRACGGPWLVVGLGSKFGFWHCGTVEDEEYGLASSPLAGSLLPHSHPRRNSTFPSPPTTSFVTELGRVASHYYIRGAGIGVGMEGGSAGGDLVLCS